MLYTRNGDSGYTKVIGGQSLLKCDVRLDAIGALDETQAHLGLARALLTGTPWAKPIRRVQVDLRFLMAECATIPTENPSSAYITGEHVSLLEAEIADWESIAGGFNGLTTPGNTVPGANLNIARTVSRRAERHVVALAQSGGVTNPSILAYLNRLSSWIYALATIVEGSPNAE